MNRQSDFGYTVSPNEHRTIELCLQRANECERIGKIEWAQQWRDEAKVLGWKP